ncbi:hypothetical protein OF385_04205 [Glutamicibacter sp. JL.03c]|uniref:hypothetical protein n=1 Tax=Glutamicibacter sp. JL.03c TaxID=2984842 RepID=UPI0021F78D12|nr:hypothetical protein [Glutamicibacter sp. JL.03c]UYQ78362.1 hypothetical protein OF385_04205 [Glutamicibacter sp. JL.03c]
MSRQTAIDMVCMGLRHEYRVLIEQQVRVSCSPGLDKPEAVRFEGQTRVDKIGMRKVFLKAGFLKEAHYRMSWPADDGTRLASVA